MTHSDHLHFLHYFKQYFNMTWTYPIRIHNPCLIPYAAAHINDDTKFFLSLFAYSRNQLRLIKRQKKLTMPAIRVTSRSNYHSKGFFSSLLWVDKKYTRRGKKIIPFQFELKNCKKLNYLHS